MKHIFRTLIAAIVLLPFSAAAQTEFPSKPVEIVVPFSPGGSGDVSARIIAAALQKQWNVPVNVINKPGGAAIPGIEYVNNAPADGHTVLWETNSTSSIILATMPDAPVEVMKRAFIGMATQGPMVMATGIDSRFDTLADVAEVAKNDPQSISWISLGGASSTDIGARLLFNRMGVDVDNTRVVVAGGGGGGVVQIAGGEVDLQVSSYATFVPLLSDNKLKLLTVFTDERYSRLPDVATSVEQGFPDTELSYWYGASAPADTPKEVLQVWEEALAKAAADPEAIAALDNIAIDPYPATAEEMRKVIMEETELLKELFPAQ